MPLATILIEDSATVRDSLMPALVESADLEFLDVAETAADGMAALQRHAKTWRLLIVDLFLREGNGLQVLRAVKDRATEQHVIVLSNYAASEIRKRSLEAGADAVFDKSMEIEALLDQCRAYGSVT